MRLVTPLDTGTNIRGTYNYLYYLSVFHNMVADYISRPKVRGVVSWI